MIKKEYIVKKDIYMLLYYLENIYINDKDIEKYRNKFIKLLENKLFPFFPKGDINDEKIIIQYYIEKKE